MSGRASRLADAVEDEHVAGTGISPPPCELGVEHESYKYR